jgi:hypothetical protein
MSSQIIEISVQIERIQKMNWWGNTPDSEMSPVDLAEKKWVLAGEEYEEVIKREMDIILYQAYRNRDGMDDRVEADKHAKITAAKARMEEAEKKKQHLWLEWVKLKPYVSDTMKAHLAEKVENRAPRWT